VERELEAALHTLLLTSDQRKQRQMVSWARLLEAAAADGNMGQVAVLLEDMVG
jgi:hypothetical protein